MIRFMLEGYTDFFIAGLINIENSYLLLEPHNWGANGHISLSDQHSLILGYVFSVAVISFPLVVIWAIKQRKLFIKTDRQQYKALYDGLTIFEMSVVEYYVLFLFRRIYFVCVAYFLSYDEHVALQIILNLLLSHFFTCYLIIFKPFSDPLTNNLEIFNEITYLIVSYHQVCFTDHNLHAETKLIAGNSMIAISVLNFCFNAHFFIKSTYDSVKSIHEKRLQKNLHGPFEKKR